jgi:hypothetical protein
LLTPGDPTIQRLLGAHRHLFAVSTRLVAAPRSRVQCVAQAALLEVASLLDGRLPLTQAEADYVEARVLAMEELAAAVTDSRVGDGESERRRAKVAATREVEQLAGSSSLTNAAELSRELLGSDDS